MNTYLAIITTVLVLTQIIRVAQNAVQLSKYEKLSNKNNEALEVFEQIAEDVQAIKNYVEVTNETL